MDAIVKGSEEYAELLDREDVEEGLELVKRDEADLPQKIINLAAYCRNLSVLAGAVKEEEKRLAERRRVMENKEKRIKAFLKMLLQKTGKRKIQTPTLTLRLQKNPPKVEVKDPLKVPENFTEIQMERVIKKQDILEHFKATGEIPPGVEIGQSERVVIK